MTYAFAFLAAAGLAFAMAADGPALLFAGAAGQVTPADQRAIFAVLDLKVAPDGKGFLDTLCEQPADATVELRDMNGDGKEEVLVVYGNTCTSGMAGASVILFIKNAAGKYEANLGFPGVTADPKPEKSQGYPDLLIGGPGFCFPVWRWDGKAYDFSRNEPQEPGGCDNR